MGRSTLVRLGTSSMLKLAVLVGSVTSLPGLAFANSSPDYHPPAGGLPAAAEQSDIVPFGIIALAVVLLVLIGALTFRWATGRAKGSPDREHDAP